MIRSRSHGTLARTLPSVATVLALAVCVSAAAPGSAEALNPIKPICSAAGWISGLAGKACGVVQHGDRFLKAGGKLLTGHVGSAAKTLAGDAASAVGSKAAAAIGLAAIGAWVVGGAKVALQGTATVLAKTTSPQLTTTWFSSTYWRIAGFAALLTLPFLFAASVQALLRSDLSLLARASLGYLPLALLVVSVAAPVTMLLLAASDQMSAAVSAAAGHAGTRFLSQVGFIIGGLSWLSRSPFLVFLVGSLAAFGAIVLWVEMLMREAALYIVVLMLPLAFSAFVWPARRVWAIRAVEVLVALILSKFAIVAVLSLGGAALGQRGSGGAGGMLAGLVLVILATFAPWALVRLLPMTELASAAAGQLRGEATRVRAMRDRADETADGAGGWARTVTSEMRRNADTVEDTPGTGNDARSQNGAGGKNGAAKNGAASEREKLAAVSAAVSGTENHSRPGDDGRGSDDGSPAVADERSADVYLPPDNLVLGPEAFGADGRLKGDPRPQVNPGHPPDPAAPPNPGPPPNPEPPGHAEGGPEHDPRPPKQEPGDGRL